MDISLLNIMRTVAWDFRRDMAQSYANALKSSIEIHLPNDTKKQRGYFLSKKGTKSTKGNFQEKLYVDNIHAIERHLYWNDEELADDDQVVDVVYIDGPVTRDGGACSYGTKDYRDQVLYANTIPQVVGHLFVINTPGGETDCRKDYDLMVADCRAKNKPTVAFIDGMCCSSGVNLASRCDRTVVMNPKDSFGCIGSMAAFWATPDGAVDQEGSRYVEIVGDESPEKNDWWREAAAGDYEKLKAVINEDTNDFHATVRENRPLVESSMLTGAIFEAQEVIPELVDEIGDMNRAIDCVFELATGSLTAARFAKNEDAGDQPKDEPQSNEQPMPDGAIQTEDNHKSQTNMTEDKRKTLQAAEQPKEPEIEEPTIAPDENVETKPEEEGEKPGEDPDEDPDENPDSEKGPDDGPNSKPDSNEGEPVTEGEESELREGSVHACGDTLEKEDSTAKILVAERDKKIAAKDEEIANLKAQLDKSKKEKDDAIAQLKKQLADLHKEVKELASEPTPMAEGTEAPKDNGTGVPETGAVRSIVTANMSANEIRKRLREQDKAIAAKRRRM
jgi:ClpP class serine protease/uncharacterized small protein (DUF1192 family)